MSMLPFFPSLRPPIANRIWFDSAAASNEEAEVLKYEREHHSWLDAMKNAAVDIHPMGKVLTMPGLETDDEDANDDSDDSEDTNEDEDTNDRAIPGLPERSALGLYSPGEEMNLNDDVPVIVGGGSQ
ncbi:anaphase-promoting complex subunit 15B [Stomoxys calcitrans]|uniref:Anaphase-promoting complex subunit 15 n=1 Tax=Stomoxys calcitrans TaxID=35570 RepID=A0A1I8Q0E8_STOCA|nr:anaphase-promoting complex subunit 15B [Stomoxys calcitrans]